MIETATLIVVIVRLIGPLIILKKPFLGAFISEFILDSADAFIWNYFGDLPINYTVIDKRLDLYSSVLMVSTVRKWKLDIPRNIAFILFGYRLIGHILLEITKDTVYLFYFANLFVLFFLFFLAAKKLGKQKYFTKPRPLTLIFLLILILKMPQEYMLHYTKVIDWEFVKQFLGM